MLTWVNMCLLWLTCVNLGSHGLTEVNLVNICQHCFNVVTSYFITMECVRYTVSRDGSCTSIKGVVLHIPVLLKVIKYINFKLLISI